MSSDDISCSTAVEVLKLLALQVSSITDYNSKKTSELQGAINKYNNVDYPGYLAKYNEWDGRRRQEYSRLANETRTWNNCVDGINCTNKGMSDLWCRNDLGDGWEFVGCSQHDCGLYRKGNCKRTEEKIKSEIVANWEVSNPPPPIPTKPSASDFPLLEYPKISNIAINCCKNMANILNSELNDSSLDQINECINNHESKISSNTESSGVKNTDNQNQQNQYGSGAGGSQATIIDYASIYSSPTTTAVVVLVFTIPTIFLLSSMFSKK
jgi:hypothetical protein